MSLPWFPFEIDAYLGNTMTLDAEGHGAYLLLMLQYYRTERPIADRDRELANITRLPADRWTALRPSLEGFFRIEGGNWHHDRIEQVMLEARSKHATAVAKAKKANAVMNAKKAPSAAKSPLQAAPEPAPGEKPPRRKPERSPKPAPSQLEANSRSTHLQEHITTLSSSNAAPKNDDDDGSAKGLSREEESPAAPNPMGTFLPADWTPSPTDIVVAKGFGMTMDDIHSELPVFHALNTQHGTMSKNWSSTWTMFCKRWKDRQPKLLPARVEVTTMPAGQHQPSIEQWEGHAKLWRDIRRWARGIGPEPGQIGCRCPVPILTALGIDPDTGERSKTLVASR